MDFYNENFHQSAEGKLYEYGRQFRKSQTEAEKELWRLIINKKINGLKFRRQHPLGNYIADFYCHEKRLVIEVDGENHDTNEQAKRDNERTIVMNRSNITVIRFRNEEVLHDSKQVIKMIKNVSNNINSPTGN
jgi:very-short-patch-repair endonuclease